MATDIPVAFLEATVFANVVQVVPADHDGALHLGLRDDSGEDATTHRAVAGERTLLIDVRSSDGLSCDEKTIHEYKLCPKQCELIFY